MSLYKAALSSSYLQSLKQLLSLQGIKYGLESSKRLAAAFGYPQTRYDCIHIAGTNGKGSTALKIASCLELSGQRVGLFTSPHVLCIRERIKVNGQMISEENFSRLCDGILHMAASKNMSVTFFEVCTQLALIYFAENSVDWAVIETGLGGKYDATNLLEKPRACVITSIGWDHMAVLGNSLEIIAGEKAGILKRQCPAVLGPSASTYTAILERAAELECPLHKVPVDPRGESFDEENSRIAEEVVSKVLNLKIDKQKLKEGLSAVPCARFQVLSDQQVLKAVKRSFKYVKNPSLEEKPLAVPKAIILDVGHNSTALDKLCQRIGTSFYGLPVRFCVNLSTERNLNLFEPLIAHFSFPNNNRLVGIHYFESRHPRARSLQSVKEELNDSETLSPELKQWILNGINQAYAFLSSSAEAQQQAESDSVQEEDNEPAAIQHVKEGPVVRLVSRLVQQSAEENSVLVFCGSFFMMHQVIRALGASIGPFDPLDTNEPSVKIITP